MAVAVTPTLRVSDAGPDDDHRGEWHRVFTPDQEQNIMERINARMAIDKRGLSDNDIANIARIYHRELHGAPLRPPMVSQHPMVGLLISSVGMHIPVVRHHFNR